MPDLEERNGILYSLVSRGSTVLAKYGRVAGNFTEVSEQILARISPADNKLSYAHGQFLFHYLSSEGITFLCVTDDSFNRAVTFAFLHEIRDRFRRLYGSLGMTAMPYSMNTEFAPTLQSQMKRYSDPNIAHDKVSQLQADTDEIKQIMIKNIDTLADRGEKLELLVEKTMELSYDAVQFNTRSKDLRKKFWWRNMKWSIAIAVVIILLLYIVASIICGPTFSDCGSS